MNKLTWVLIGLFMSMPLMQFTSCKRIDDLNANLSNAIGVLDTGIDMMNSQSSSWRETLEYVYDNMPEAMHHVKEDIQVLISESMGGVASTIICIADAVPTRVLNQLIRMRTKLEDGYVARICATVCETNINEIDLREPYYVYDKLAIFGYDFPVNERMFIVLRSTDGQETGIPADVRLSKLSNYEIVISLAGLESLLSQYNKLIFMCDNTVISEFLIIPG